jgi:hypothetical protein
MQITSLDKSAGCVNDEVIIRGKALRVITAGRGSVTFNGVQAVVHTWDEDEIRCTVPVGAVSGPLTVASGNDKVEVPFTVDSVSTPVVVAPVVEPTVTPKPKPPKKKVTKKK